MKPEPGEARRCFWPWSHQWEPWTLWERGRLARIRHIADEILKPELEQIVGTYETQRRICKRCGKAQLRETRT